jgi:diaminohydroxyphosphoribosylaminopyrimidine deaminase / 5-amino-6-(5-phosphoribosylamino)uracil reductase
MKNHEYYMKMAMELAKVGWGRTNPNPLVGAVIVKDGEIIGEGYHTALGCNHAEVEAILKANKDVHGSTIYVNLEPCSHYGRTPPCSKAIIEAGIKQVVTAMTDPNPKVSGCGIKMLREAGVSVVEGVLEKEAKILNEVFIKYITKKRPFVIMKAAMTLDGKIATSTGDSKWVTGESSRNYVHMVRDRVSSIMVGINTVLCDNPSLTTRLNSKEGKNPVRIVIDSSGRIPEDCRILNLGFQEKSILATTSKIDSSKEKCLTEKGMSVLKCDGKDGRVDLDLLMNELYRLGIDSILLEGGGTINWSALEAGIVDKAMFFIAPKIVGGYGAVTPVEGVGISQMRDAFKLKDISCNKFGEDTLIEGYIDYD